jgi:dihydrofolate reductase
MTKLTVIASLTLDGVMQAPGRSDEDPSGGFEHGGWAQPYNDEVLGREMGRHMAQRSSLLFGRRTYEAFYAFWPEQAGNPYAGAIERTGNDAERRFLERRRAALLA